MIRRSKVGNLPFPLILAGGWLLWGMAPSANGAYTAIDLYTLSLPGSENHFPPAFSTTMFGQQIVGYSALLYDGSGTPTNLTPTNLSGFIGFTIDGTDGSQQAGYGTFGTAFNWHAILWSGAANSAIDLNPTGLAGVNASQGMGVGGDQQVGSGSGPATENGYHALLWTGSAASAVDLNPAQLGITSSGAMATDGVHQIGFGSGSGSVHALLWSGTATSAVDLHPTGLPVHIADSRALGLGGNQQVGFVDLPSPAPGVDGPMHGILWSGTADSAIDLNPTDLPGMTNSYAISTNGIQQVGWIDSAPFGPHPHAVVWDGTAASAVDLQSVMPGFAQSIAYNIDPAGNIFGVGKDSSGKFHAIEWVTLFPDLNGDHRIGLDDLLTLAQHYGSTQATFSTGDINGDGKVDFSDLLILAQHYGQSALQQPSPAVVTPVPEPIGLAILGLESLALLRRARRVEEQPGGSDAVGP